MPSHAPVTGGTAGGGGGGGASGIPYVAVTVANTTVNGASRWANTGTAIPSTTTLNLRVNGGPATSTHMYVFPRTGLNATISGITPLLATTDGDDQGGNLAQVAAQTHGPWINILATAPASGSFQNDVAIPVGALGPAYIWFALVFVQIPTVVSPAAGVIVIDGFSEIVIPEGTDP